MYCIASEPQGTRLLEFFPIQFRIKHTFITGFLVYRNHGLKKHTSVKVFYY